MTETNITPKNFQKQFENNDFQKKLESQSTDIKLQLKKNQNDATTSKKKFLNENNQNNNNSGNETKNRFQCSQYSYRYVKIANSCSKRIKFPKYVQKQNKKAKHFEGVIELVDPANQKKEYFRVFDDLQLGNNESIQKTLHKTSLDNDCLTDSETMQWGIERTRDDLLEAFETLQKNQYTNLQNKFSSFLSQSNFDQSYLSNCGVMLTSDSEESGDSYSDSEEKSSEFN